AVQVATGEVTLHLVKDDFPITGRVLDLEGKPVASATVERQSIMTTPAEDLTPTLKASSDGSRAFTRASKTLGTMAMLGLDGKTTTDREGRFRLPGVGPERIVSLRIEGPTIQHKTLYVVPRPEADIKAIVESQARQM